ncbi:hypothetical protein BOX15_Mlig017457g1 [Macrostomum lignano]|uniref:LITAF domain-containing protein n=1 Tax=Macrostomum lignano TaxID=282301 RepID=A0A267F3J0_9PLAT|nr:hypothetical protein BOX15_Mlig017457g1 [Macrostomum lignano]
MESKSAPPPDHNQPPPGYYPPPPQQQSYPPQQQGYPPQQQGYPPQQQGYPPLQYGGYQPAPQTQQPQVQVVTVSTSPTVFRDVPINIPCQHCQQVVTSRIEFENGLLVWLLVGAICFFGIPLFLFLGCCFIPLCIPSLKDVGHFCPNCNRKLGTYQRVR